MTAAVGVQVEHLGDEGCQQVGVVADHDQAAAVAAQVVTQPGHRVGVEVVGRLVEQQGGGAAEQDPGQFHPAALAARQGAQRLLQYLGGQPEAGRERRGLCLGGVAAQHCQALLKLAVPSHRRVTPGRILVAHADLGLPHPGQHLVEAAGLEYPVGGECVQVADPGVLRQVADRPAAVHSPGGWLALAGQHLQQRGLSCPVPAHQPDLVARRDLERHIVDKQPRTSAQFKIISRDHREVARSQKVRYGSSDFGTKRTSVGPRRLAA